MPPRMPCLFGAERLGGILDQWQAVALEKSGDRVHDRIAVRPHAAPDQDVPITVSRNNAIRKAQIGRFNVCRKFLKSRVGVTAIKNRTPKMPTIEVDQGSASAIRMAKISANFT